MAKVLVDGIEVEESELTDFQKGRLNNPISVPPEILYSNKVPSKIEHDLKPIYELDKDYIFTGRSMAYYKDKTKKEANDSLFERWTPCPPMCAPLEVTEKCTGVTSVLYRVKLKDGEESKLNKLDQRVIMEFVKE